MSRDSNSGARAADEPDDERDICDVCNRLRETEKHPMHKPGSGGHIDICNSCLKWPFTDDE
jgi:hypothetical protein